MDTTPRTFTSVEDECRYWKERAKQYYKEWTDVKQEYDEYVEQSRQMEAEMDATLDQKQGIIKDLRQRVSSLENENESLKHKFESQCTELTNIEKQLESIKTERENMRENMRQLEQKNDDLERAHRILNESIADVSRLLDKAYEKNALLEMEVDEKEALQEKLQRLMDETRDLKQEINVKSRHQVNGVVNSTTTNGSALNSEKLHGMTTAADSADASALTTNDNKRHHQHRNYHRNSASTNLNEYSQQSLKNPDNLINGNAMSASSRTNALNIVADMLRKLNLDKAFLCPQCDRFRCVCERPTPTTPTSPFPSNSTAADSSIKRLSRSLTNTFGGSKDSVHTNTNTQTTPVDTSVSTPDEPENSLLRDCNTSVILNRNSSHSNSSLNMGSSILKRFTDRLSGNTNQTTSSDPINTISTNVITTHSIASDK